MIDIQNMLAAVGFTPMTDIPFLTSSLSGDVGGATEMFNALFKLSITIGAMLAVFMFIFGGLQMITARDSAGSVGEGRDKMTNAVMGLLMLISTYVVLNTINPQLTSLTLFKDANGKDISKLEAAPRGATDRKSIKDTDLKQDPKFGTIGSYEKQTAAQIFRSKEANDFRTSINNLRTKKVSVFCRSGQCYKTKQLCQTNRQGRIQQAYACPPSQVNATTPVIGGEFVVRSNGIREQFTYIDKEACEITAKVLNKTKGGAATCENVN